VWSATGVARAAQPDALDTDAAAADVAAVDDETVGVTWRRGRAGTAIGRAVHGTLQLVDFGSLDRLDSIARAQAAAEGVDAYLDLVAGLARAGATSPLITDLSARRHWREMYVAAPIEGVTIEGYVDLLAEDGAGGLVVVDYKTDSVHGAAQIAERTDRYRLQAATYALALEAVTGLPVSRAVFLFLGRDGATASDVDDLAAAKVEARAILAGPAGSATSQ
jgi:ATP-dependent helicase/nuclease subunit A